LSFKKKIAHVALPALCFSAALALTASSAAKADDFSGLLTGGYSNESGHGTNDDVWHIDATGAVTLGDSGFNAQVSGGYANDSDNTCRPSSCSFDVWHGGGTVFYRMPDSQLGALVDYIGVNGGHATEYGGFGDYYLSDSLTVGIEGGGLDEGHGASGGFVGGNFTWYVVPDFALKIYADYIPLNSNEGSLVGIEGEYLVSHEIPVGVYLGDTYTHNHAFGATFNANVVSIGLRWHLDSGTSLVDHQRNGVAHATQLSSVLEQ
jgi:hypothetical protein